MLFQRVQGHSRFLEWTGLTIMNTAPVRKQPFSNRTVFAERLGKAACEGPSEREQANIPEPPQTHVLTLKERPRAPFSDLARTTRSSMGVSRGNDGSLRFLQSF